MTRIKVKTDEIVYTNLTPAEVRSYLQGGVKAGSFDGFTDLAGTIPITISVHAVVYVFKQ